MRCQQMKDGHIDMGHSKLVKSGTEQRNESDLTKEKNDQELIDGPKNVVGNFEK